MLYPLKKAKPAPAQIPYTKSQVEPTPKNTPVESRLPLFLQRSPLMVSHPADADEIEAERVAGEVMRMPNPSSQTLHRCACGGIAGPDGECAACKTKRLELQRKSDTTGGTVAPPSVHQTLHSSGQPLDTGTRSFMESRFGQDFSGVRIHTDSQAARSAADVHARAYTVGQDIVFGAGQYARGTSDGQRLIAHELTHVVQQGQSPSALSPDTLHRYSHQDCTDPDLRTHIWPADAIARRKVAAAISAVTASPVAPTTQALFAKYFMTRTPNVTTIAQVFRQLKRAFDDNNYTYECEDDCDPGENAYSGRAWDIHLCMNNLRGRANDCIARTIIHEFSHKYAGTGHGWIFSTAYCYSGCDTAGCPASLSASDALDNAYSYAGFAHEL